MAACLREATLVLIESLVIATANGSLPLIMQSHVAFMGAEGNHLQASVVFKTALHQMTVAGF